METPRIELGTSSNYYNFKLLRKHYTTKPYPREMDIPSFVVGDGSVSGGYIAKWDLLRARVGCLRLDGNRTGSRFTAGCYAKQWTPKDSDCLRVPPLFTQGLCPCP